LLAAKGFCYSSPTATRSAGCTRVNVGGAYVGDFSSGLPTPVRARPAACARPTPPKAVLACGCAQQGGVATARLLKGNARSSLRSRIDDGDSLSAGCFRLPLAASGRLARGRTRSAAPAIVNNDTTLKSARGTGSAPDGFVGRSPQGEVS
jgi:hypothetical protein